MEEQIELMDVDIITNSDIAIRKEDVKDENYIGLKQDIKGRFERGEDDHVQQPIIVREEKDQAEPEKINIILVDGLQRLTACRELGIKQIRAINKGAISKLKALTDQFAANHHRIKQKPAAEGQQFNRMLTENPDFTAASLADLVGCTIDYINGRMRIAKKLIPQAQQLVDEGQIILLNAKTLCLINLEEQVNFLDNAMSMPPREFSDTVKAYKDQQNKDIREGGGGKKVEPVFKAAPHTRKQAEILEEIDSAEIAKSLYPDNVAAQKAFTSGAAWAIEMDEQTVTEKEEKWAARKEEMARKKKERQVENERKKAERQMERADKAAAELEGNKE